MDSLLIFITLIIVGFIAYILSRPFIEAKSETQTKDGDEDQER